MMLSICANLGKVRYKAQTGQAQCAQASNNSQDRPTHWFAGHVHDKSPHQGGAGNQNKYDACRGLPMKRPAFMLYFICGLHRV